MLNRQGSTLPPPVSNVESGVVRIEHRDPSFSFHRTYVIAGTPREAAFTRRTDGAESSETGPQGLVTVSTLRWDGPALLLAMRIKGPGFEATNDVRYELLDGGRRLRATEQGRSPHGQPRRGLDLRSALTMAAISRSRLPSSTCCWRSPTATSTATPS